MVRETLTKDQWFSEKEALARFEATVRIMLNTRPKWQSNMKKPKPRPIAQVGPICVTPIDVALRLGERNE